MTSHRFSDYCDVRLGFKSFLNDFFYVDQATIDRFGIEDEHLVELYRLKDLDGSKFLQDEAVQVWLFNCSVGPIDLRGTGAGRYVAWGEQQKTQKRKQSKKSVPWPDAPALKHSAHWYFPAAPTHAVATAVRKGINDVYAPFLFQKPIVLDQRLYLVEPKEGISIELVRAYLASTLFALALETEADAGLGAGVLTLRANALRALPTIDLAGIDGSTEKKILRKAKRLFANPPPKANELPERGDVQELDRKFLEAVGIDPDRASELATDVVRLAATRLAKSRKRKKVSVEKATADIELVASRVADGLRAWLEARRIPEDLSSTDDVVCLTLPNGPLVFQLNPLMDQCEVTILSGEATIFHDTVTLPTAELILRSAQLGRRYDLLVPAKAADAYESLELLGDLLDDFVQRFQDSVTKSSIGSRHYDEVFDVVQSEMNVPLDALHAEFIAGEIEIL